MEVEAARKRQILVEAAAEAEAAKFFGSGNRKRQEKFDLQFIYFSSELTFSWYNFVYEYFVLCVMLQDVKKFQK